MRHLLDTNVVSEWSKAQPNSQVVEWVERQSPFDLAVSAITLAEVHYGIEILPPGRKTNLLWRWYHDDFVRLIADRVVPIDAAVALHWSGLRARSRRAGRTLPFADSSIVSTAVIHGLVVVTRNVKDFDGLGVDVFNPWDGTAPPVV
jgi:predicted nucleic acid-binding protein